MVRCMVRSGDLGPAPKAACAPLSRQQLRPPPGCIMHSTRTSDLSMVPCQAAGAKGCPWMAGVALLACAQCCLSVSPLLHPSVVSRIFACVCVCVCSKPVDEVWGLRGPNTQTVHACSRISIAYLLVYNLIESL